MKRPSGQLRSTRTLSLCTAPDVARGRLEGWPSQFARSGRGCLMMQHTVTSVPFHWIKWINPRHVYKTLWSRLTGGALSKLWALFRKHPALVPEFSCRQTVCLFRPPTDLGPLDHIKPRDKTLYLLYFIYRALFKKCRLQGVSQGKIWNKKRHKIIRIKGQSL